MMSNPESKSAVGQQQPEKIGLKKQRNRNGDEVIVVSNEDLKNLPKGMKPPALIRFIFIESSSESEPEEFEKPTPPAKAHTNTTDNNKVEEEETRQSSPKEGDDGNLFSIVFRNLGISKLEVDLILSSSTSSNIDNENLVLSPPDFDLDKDFYFISKNVDSSKSQENNNVQSISSSSTTTTSTSFSDQDKGSIFDLGNNQDIIDNSKLQVDILKKISPSSTTSFSDKGSVFDNIQKAEGSTGSGQNLEISSNNMDFHLEIDDYIKKNIDAGDSDDDEGRDDNDDDREPPQTKNISSDLLLLSSQSLSKSEKNDEPLIFDNQKLAKLELSHQMKNKRSFSTSSSSSDESKMNESKATKPSKYVEKKNQLVLSSPEPEPHDYDSNSKRRRGKPKPTQQKSPVSKPVKVKAKDEDKKIKKSVKNKKIKKELVKKSEDPFEELDAYYSSTSTLKEFEKEEEEEDQKQAFSKPEEILAPNDYRSKVNAKMQLVTKKAESATPNPEKVNTNKKDKSEKIEKKPTIFNSVEEFEAYRQSVPGKADKHLLEKFFERNKKGPGTNPEKMIVDGEEIDESESEDDESCQERSFEGSLKRKKKTGRGDDSDSDSGQEEIGHKAGRYDADVGDDNSDDYDEDDYN